MVQYENVIKMPLNELLSYYQALKGICEFHENELRPLYNSRNPKDQMKWVEVNNELQHAKLYFDVVLNALKYKAFHGLDEYKPLSSEDKYRPKDIEKPKIAKKPVKPSERVRNTKKKGEIK